MAATTDGGLLLRDPEGQYFLLTPELLQQATIPPEQAEALIAAQGDDVTGLAFINNSAALAAKAAKLQAQNAAIDAGMAEARARADAAMSAATYQLWAGIAGGLFRV